ncbi:immunoglobulin superfamily member 10 [Stegostoma tigrinum]|uniref:immunoglobulin superfamily member 10 n=1 Tax=Stegostoma tigrinum TaxID=3053191 RepID=UPI00202B7926|nr:immunoglobulin superfamily member 10 [Stegostoma tigrinum]
MSAVHQRSLSLFSGRCGLLVTLAALVECWCLCAACPKLCACYVPTEIHCTFRYLSAIPDGILTQVERINLGYNNLMKLTSTSFAGLKNLELLMLHSNKIQEIPDKVFQDLESLQVLKMSYNKIKALNRETFHGLRNIVRLHMDHNSIEFINPEAFYGLTSLKLVHLEGNMLQELHRDTFVTFRFSQIFKMSSIKHIYLSDNALTSIPSDLLSYIPELESIYLHGNQWSCDCNLRWLTELNERLPGTIKCKRDRNYPNGQICPLCTSPGVTRGKDILQLPPSVFACTPPSIQSPLKIRNSSLQEEGDYAAVNAKDFVAPLGQMSLNMSDQSGNGCEITCNIHRPVETPQVSLDQKEGYVLLNSSLSTFLVCYVNYEQIQRLWGILAMYADSPLRLEKDTLLSKTPHMSYLYKQSAASDLHQFTGVEMQIRADPAWLMQDDISLQMDRTQTTLNVLQIKYQVEVQINLQDLEAKPGKNSWVMIKKAKDAKTEHFVVVGGTVELECQAIGDPKPIIAWILPDGSKVRAPYSSDDSRISVSADGKFVLRIADLYDTGIYHCVGTNYQDADVLSFRVIILDPNVVESYINGPYISKSGGDSILLPCQATGIPNASISWVLPDHRVLQQTTGSKEITPNGTLKIKKLTTRDSGYYRCLAANRYGIDLLALQLMVTGSRISPENEIAESNDRAEGDFGSGESEEDLLESEDMKHGQFSSQSTSEDETYAITTSSSQLTPYLEMSRAATVSPRRRIHGIGTKPHRWPNRRRLKQPRKRVDPQHWAEYLAKVRKKVSIKTATRKITIKPHVKDLLSERTAEEETSGADLEGAEEKEFIVVVTTPPTIVSSTPSHPITETSTEIGPQLKLVLPDVKQFHTTEPDAKAVAPPIPKVATDSSLLPKVTETITKKEPISVISHRPTATPRVSEPPEANAELQLTISSNFKEPHYMSTPTPIPLTIDTPKEHTSSISYTTGKVDLVSQSETERLSDNHTHIATVTVAKEDGNRILFKTTQKISSPLTTSLSTILTQQLHIVREVTTGAPVSKPRRLEWRRKFPHRRRFGRPGMWRHRYKIVRPKMRRPAWSEERTTLPTLMHSEASSTNHMPSVTQVPLGPPLPQPAPVPNGSNTRSMQASIQQSGDLNASEATSKHSRVYPTEEMQRVNDPEVGTTWSQWVTRADSGTQTPESETTTQLTETSSVAKTTHTSRRLPGRSPYLDLLSTPTGMTAEPSTLSSKIVREKIPWNRLFGVKNQKDALRRLSKPIKSSQAKSAAPKMSIILTKPTPHSVMASQAIGGSLKPHILTSNSSSNQMKLTTNLPAVFLHIPSTTNPPTTVTTIPTTAATIQTTHTTRRMGFRRRISGKFKRPRKRIQPSSRATLRRNRLGTSAAESRKMRPTKTRIPLSPDTSVPTEASHDVATAVNTAVKDAQSNKPLLTSVGMNPTTITRQYNSRFLHLPSNPPTSQSTVRPLNTTNLITPVPTTSKTTARGIPIIKLQSSTITEATRRSTIQKIIHPTKMTLLPPAIEATSATTTIAPSTGSSVLSTTVTASSNQSAIPARSPPRTVPRFRITLRRFTTSEPPKQAQPLLPESRIDTPLWQNLQTKAISTVQTSTETKWETPLGFTEGSTRDRVAPPKLDGDLENTIGNEGGKDDVLNRSNALSHNIIAVDPMSQKHPAKPRLIGGNTASFTFVADSDAFIPCKATGNPLPIISWTKISTGATVTAKVKRGNKFEVFPNGTLTIQKITVQDRGQYLCIAENQYGSERLLVTLSVVAYPSKILEPRMKDIIVHAGYPVEMKCRSQGRPAPTISWILSNRTLVRNSSPFNGRVSVLADGTLKIKAVTVYDQGNYRCVASNPAGIDTVTVRMQVVAQPPAILEARQDSVKGQEGQNIRLPCTAVGTPAPSVRWVLFDGTEIRPLQFINTKVFVFTNGTLYVKSLTPSDSGNYECIATSSTGSERRVVSLMVERKHEIPKIVSASSSNNKVNYGDKLQLHCSATGNPKPKIIWRLPSKLIVDQWHRMASRVLVWPNGTLSIESITERDAGIYLCIARNKAGDDMRSLTIDVSMKPALIERKQSVHKHVSYGSDLQVDCEASGFPKPEISWSLPDGTMVNNMLQEDDSGRRIRRYIVFGNGTLYYNKVGLAEEGDYTCYAQNTLGKDEMKVHVTVMTMAPHIKKPYNRSLKVISGGNAMFHCQAVGKPLPRILWMLPTNEIISFSKSRYHLHSNGSLLIKNARLSDAGEYMCIARNPGGDDTDLFRLDVASKPPLINGLPRNKTVVKDYAVRHSQKQIDCRVEGVPKPYITWIMPDNIMLNAPYYGSRIVVHLNGTLEIRNVRASDNAEFVCVARNDAGEAMLVVNLEVTRRLQRPVFRNPFNKKIVARAEGPTILNCSADGYPPPEIIWILPNGTRLTGSHKAAHYQINSDGTFRIHGPTAEDAGKYRCAAKNTIGYIEKLIILEVGQKPIIHTRPLGLIRSMSGDALYLHCSANGRPTPKIVWTVPSGYILNRPQINPRYILFENGTLVVREMSVRDRGNYICKAYNNAGDDSSVTSVIVIAYPPRITNGPPKSVQAFAGRAVQLNCMAIGIPRPEIVWELPNHRVLSTFSKGRSTSSELLHPQGTLVIQKLLAKDSGTYKCTAKSQLGSDSRLTYIQVI